MVKIGPIWRTLFSRFRGRPAPTDYGVVAFVYRELKDGSRESIQATLEATGHGSAEITATLALQDLARAAGFKAFSRAVSDLSDAMREALPIEMPSGARQEAQESLSKRYAEYLRDKTVVLTGPASHVLGGERGAEIEGFDVVVRLNFQWPIASPLVADLGRRMDVLYHCCNGDFPLDGLFGADFSKAQFVLMEQGVLSRRLMRHCEKVGVPAFYVSGEYGRLARQLGSPPSTGVVAVKHLLAQPIRELHTIGLTFWQSSYYQGYKGHGTSAFFDGFTPSKIWKHDPKREAKYIASLCRMDPRLQLDAEAKQVFAAAGLFP